MACKTADGSSPIDWTLIEQRGLDEPLMRAILPTFLEENGRRLRRLKNALDDQNYDELQMQAHTIKGSAANVGAMELSEAARALNETCNRQQYDEAPCLLERIDRESERVAAYLQTKGWYSGF